MQTIFFNEIRPMKRLISTKCAGKMPQVSVGTNRCIGGIEITQLQQTVGFNTVSVSKGLTQTKVIIAILIYLESLLLLD